MKSVYTYLHSLFLLFFITAHSIAHADLSWRCGTPMLVRNIPPVVHMAPQLPQVPAAPAPEVHLGQIDRFFTHIPEQLVKGTCIAIGEHIYIYIENSVSHMMTEAEAIEIAAEFDSRIYPQVHRWMGTEWKPGLDRDARVTLLMHDVGANASGRDFGGYFSPTDQRPTDLNSNRQEIVFMDVFQFKERARFTFYSSLAHEFAHLVNWFQNGGTTDERWLEEGIASFVEWGIYSNIHNIFVDGYLRDPSVSLTSANTADVYYGATFTLLLYLFDHYGGREFIRELARQDALGTRAIDGALAALGKPERFADVFQNWALANFVNDINRGSLLGYKNLPNRRVTAQIQQVSSYPTIRFDSLDDWGVRYVVLRNLPSQLEIALDGTGEGLLHAQIAHLPSNGPAAIHPIGFDENNNGRIELENLKPVDRVILMVTTTSASSFRYAATADGNSQIAVGPLRPVRPSIVPPDTVTQAIGNQALPSLKRSNISYKLEPISQVHLSSNYQDVVVVGVHAYAASDWGLEIFDLQTPTQPSLIGEIATPGNAQGVAVDGDVAYVADGVAGVQVIDVSRPTSPRLIKTVEGFDHAHRIQIANGFAYIVDNSTKGLRIFDLQEIRNSPHPQPISTFPTRGDAYNVWVDGDTVYLSDERDGFQILDFGRIDIPAIAGKVGILGFDFQVVDGYAYVASGNLQIVDVRNRFKPEVIATLQTPGLAAGIEFQDGYVYLADFQSGIHVIDVRNRTRPKVVAIQPTAGNATGLALFQTFAYVADSRKGIQSLDLSNPKRPRWLNQYNASGATYGLDIVAAEGGKQFAYIADGHGGLKIVEISGAFNATLTHHIPIDGFAVDVRVDKGYAYIAADESGLVIVDLRDANRPRLVSRIDTPQPAWGLEIDGGYAYIGAGELIVLDIRVPDNSRIVARREMPGSAYRISIADGRAYVAALDGGMQIFDITNPENPRAIGEYATKGNAINMTIEGNRAYVLDSLVGVQIVDITDVLRPVLVAEYETDVLPIDAQIHGTHLYLLDQESVQIVDTRDFKLVSRFDELRFPSGLQVIGDAVYVTDLYELRIFKINEHLFELSVDHPTVFGKPVGGSKTAIVPYTNQLEQNFPNPFNPETWMPYEIAEDASVTIQIYAPRGSLIRRLDVGLRHAGRYATRTRAAYWDGRNDSGESVSSGVYFYRIDAGGYTATRKMTLRR
ncbi:hypothetical protein IH992_28770 [Candidatus Poribacteria bacterium]|nr:hypothetical protein [Candidatus Poribacteria bacterium]